MRKKISKLIYIMSKKFEYPIEKFLYDDDYTNEDLKILELDSNELQNIVDQENKEQIIKEEIKEEEKKIIESKEVSNIFWWDDEIKTLNKEIPIIKKE